MFSQASEYALRALTILAEGGGQDWVLTSHLAERARIPVHYLAKVLQTLARRGLLESQRGRQGGFRLARAPSGITAWDVVSELDDSRALYGCVMGESECSDATACPLHSLWKTIRDRFIRVLQTTTLEDLARFEATRPPSGRMAAVRPGRGAERSRGRE
ncbi:MAG: Rrf2 family transcriptional regulator [Planctomycetes bacterium]|jgi:Rrf2 family protein|nr:Rrf2 family transcriptional regulator [Planctomycetota bacterium]MCL4729779.1 Rrf2 family transcriptional regulator [Planctomycetota bacterium]